MYRLQSLFSGYLLLVIEGAIGVRIFEGCLLAASIGKEDRGFFPIAYHIE